MIGLWSISLRSIEASAARWVRSELLVLGETETWWGVVAKRVLGRRRAMNCSGADSPLTVWTRLIGLAIRDQVGGLFRSWSRLLRSELKLALFANDRAAAVICFASLARADS